MRFVVDSSPPPTRFPSYQDQVRVVVSDFEENLDKSSFKDPREYAIANARGKAREVTVGTGASLHITTSSAQTSRSWLSAHGMGAFYYFAVSTVSNLLES